MQNSKGYLYVLLTICAVSLLTFLLVFDNPLKVRLDSTESPVFSPVIRNNTSTGIATELTAIQKSILAKTSSQGVQNKRLSNQFIEVDKYKVADDLTAEELQKVSIMEQEIAQITQQADAMRDKFGDKLKFVPPAELTSEQLTERQQHQQQFTQREALLVNELNELTDLLAQGDAE